MLYKLEIEKSKRIKKNKKNNVKKSVKYENNKNKKEKSWNIKKKIIRKMQKLINVRCKINEIKEREREIISKNIK